MAKTQMTKGKFIGLLAFIALIISALCKIVSLIGGNLGIIDLVGQAFLIACVLMSAYTYAKTCSKNWQIAYWVIAAISILGLVIGAFKII